MLSVKDTLIARDIGAAGVILSHHHDLMHWAVPPVYLLPEIRRAVGKDFPVIADGGIEDGFDAFKALALGADMVCVGRVLMPPYQAEGPEGVARKIREITDEMKSMMYRTAAADVRSIDPAVIHRL